ncbi:MAG: hypothetical protein LBQ66_13005 [Planctomycetaceae bacterium]|nr:hypothetical protein [Planctomycetaceae bacterium]
MRFFILLIVLCLVVFDVGCRADGKSKWSSGSLFAKKITNKPIAKKSTNDTTNNTEENQFAQDSDSLTPPPTAPTSPHLASSSSSSLSLSSSSSSSSAPLPSGWPDEISVPPEIANVLASDNSADNSRQNKTASKNVAQKVAQTKTTNTAKNNKHKLNDDVIVPPRPLESPTIAPIPLENAGEQNVADIEKYNPDDESNDNDDQLNSKRFDHQKKSAIKTVVANEDDTDSRSVVNAAENGSLSLRDFETILINAKWQPNIQLDRWIDNGMKNPHSQNPASAKKRREEINKLNMSDKDKLKHNNHREYIEGLISTWRWYNQEIDQFVKQQLSPDQESRPNFPVDPKIFLTTDSYKNSKYDTLRANAAILMGRCNDYSATEYLIEIIKSKRQDNIRCAAIETLGEMSEVDFEMLLTLLDFECGKIAGQKDTDNKSYTNDINSRKLSDSKNAASENAAKSATKNVSPDNKIVWAELLTAIAKKIDPWEHPCFLDSFSSDQVEIRRTTARLWRIRSQALLDDEQEQEQEQEQENEFDNTNGKPKNLSLRKKLPQQLPRRFIVFARSEDDLQTRIEIMKTLGYWKERETLDVVRGDLNHAYLSLRLSAIDAIAAADCAGAERILREKLRDSSGKIRAKSVQGLCRIGYFDDALQLADDKDRDVRIEVAKAIAFTQKRIALKIAQRYIEEDIEEIKLAVLNSLERWDDIKLSGAILIEALKSKSIKTRMLSAEILSAYLPAAESLCTNKHLAGNEQNKLIAIVQKQFDQYFDEIDELPDNKPQISLAANSNGKLNNRTQQKHNQYKDEIEDDNETDEETEAGLSANEVSDVDIDYVHNLIKQWTAPELTLIQREALRRQLVRYGDRLIVLIEILYDKYDDFDLPESFDVVLTDSGVTFEQVLLLDSETPIIRQKAATELARQSKVNPHGKLITSRVLTRALKETEPIMLGAYLELLKNSDHYRARIFAEHLLKSKIPDLRKRACDVFGEVGNGYDLTYLAQRLVDKRREVSYAAFAAMIEILRGIHGNEFENERTNAAEILRLQIAGNNNDPLSQAEIGAAMYALGDDAGIEIISRTSYSTDPRARLQVINVIKALNDPNFIAIPIRYLDDKENYVCQAAIDVLPQLAGVDEGIIETEIPFEHELSQIQRKIIRWKKWYKQKTLGTVK